jgi:Ni/Fe-hydrogenase subunit HybB-like protein
VSLARMLGYFVIQFLYISCGCLELAVHSNILALKRYHGFSPAAFMIGCIFIHFCIFQKL